MRRWCLGSDFEGDKWGAAGLDPITALSSRLYSSLELQSKPTRNEGVGSTGWGFHGDAQLARYWRDGKGGWLGFRSTIGRLDQILEPGVVRRRNKKPKWPRGWHWTLKNPAGGWMQHRGDGLGKCVGTSYGWEGAGWEWECGMERQRSGWRAVKGGPVTREAGRGCCGREAQRGWRLGAQGVQRNDAGRSAERALAGRGVREAAQRSRAPESSAAHGDVTRSAAAAERQRIWAAHRSEERLRAAILGLPICTPWARDVQMWGDGGYGDEGEIVQIWKGHISGLMGYNEAVVTLFTCRDSGVKKQVIMVKDAG
ncbi:hypothetical protein C8J57DRAFT_1240527 [Mycena rebaudengoi]|nr:hypothetical protein C8J57DRAFT_1240527 [Mycena rebaudengoi]